MPFRLFVQDSRISVLTKGNFRTGQLEIPENLQKPVASILVGAIKPNVDLAWLAIILAMVYRGPVRSQVSRRSLIWRLERSRQLVTCAFSRAVSCLVAEATDLTVKASLKGLKMARDYALEEPFNFHCRGEHGDKNAGLTFVSARVAGVQAR